MSSNRLFLIVILLFSAMQINAQPEPYRYKCKKIDSSTDLENNFIKKSVWEKTDPISDFVDLATGEAAPLLTRAKMLRSDSCLYILVEMETEHLWATLTENETRVYLDNAVELFFDPDGDGLNYVEFQINALSTTWDILMPKPYRNGGDAVSCYDMRGVQKKIELDGTLNDPSDKDKGWNVALVIPFENFRGLCSGSPYPKAGHEWRINIARVNWNLLIKNGKYKKVPNPKTEKEKRSFWVWRPHGEINMHMPEMFGTVVF